MEVGKFSGCVLIVGCSLLGRASFSTFVFADQTRWCSYRLSNHSSSLTFLLLASRFCSCRVWVDNGYAASVLDITTERDEYFLWGIVENFVTLRVR